jgi:hypothetical protein
LTDNGYQVTKYKVQSFDEKDLRAGGEHGKCVEFNQEALKGLDTAWGWACPALGPPENVLKFVDMITLCTTIRY